MCSHISHSAVLAVYAQANINDTVELKPYTGSLAAVFAAQWQREIHIWSLHFLRCRYGSTTPFWTPPMKRTSAPCSVTDGSAAAAKSHASDACATPKKLSEALLSCLLGIVMNESVWVCVRAYWCVLPKERESNLQSMCRWVHGPLVHCDLSAFSRD